MFGRIWRVLRNRLILNGDTILFYGFVDIMDDDTIVVIIYDYNKVVISRIIPRPDAILSAHNIIKLTERSYSDQSIVDKLVHAGVKSGAGFLKLSNRYIADLFN